MPFARCGTSAVNGKIYVIGGTGKNWIDVFSTVEEYTPEGCHLLFLLMANCQ
jgi:hypothetical protein